MVTSVAPAALACGLAIGLLQGVTGAGGALVAVPILVFVFGEDPQAATSAALVIVGVGSLAGAVEPSRARAVRWRTALGLGGASLPGAIVGTAANRALSDDLLLLAYGLLLCVVAYATLRSADRASTPEPSPTARERWRSTVSLGLLVGLLSGLFGVTGGFLIVPALVVLIGLPIGLAVGTSLVVQTLVSAVALTAHLASGPIDLGLTTALTLGAVAGGVAGSRLGRRLPERTVTLAFAGLVALVAVSLLLRSALVIL